MKTSKAALSISLAILLTSAMSAAADTKTDAHSESTDASGTKVIVDESAATTIDSSGTIKAVGDHKSTEDPKGLGNKTKESSHSETKIMANGEREDKETTVDAAGTKTEYSAEVKIDNHVDGAKTTTIESKTAVDPKGLLNKQTAEIKKDIKTAPDGSLISSTVTKQVNGKPVAETAK